MIAELLVSVTLFAGDAKYDGLHERRDRKVIAKMIGADPVRTRWCGLWLAYVMRKQGLPVPKHPALAASWATWGKPVRGALRAGDVVVLRGHVARFVKYAGGRVCLRGGNQNNQVKITCYKRSRVVTIRRHS